MLYCYCVLTSPYTQISYTYMLLICGLVFKGVISWYNNCFFICFHVLFTRHTRILLKMLSIGGLVFQMTPSGIISSDSVLFSPHLEFMQDAVDGLVFQGTLSLKKIICYNVPFFSTFGVMRDAVDLRWIGGLVFRGEFHLLWCCSSPHSEFIQGTVVHPKCCRPGYYTSSDAIPPLD